MNLIETMTILKSSSVKFGIDDGRLIVDASDSILTPEFETALRQYKSEILQTIELGLLSAAAITNDVWEGDSKPNPSSSSAEPLSASEILKQAGITTQYITDKHSAEQVISALVKIANPIGLDIETVKLDGYEDHKQAGLAPPLSRIRLIQLYTGGKEVYVFDVKALGGISILSPIWDLNLVAHNAKFEIKHLIHAGINIQNIDCTMLQTNALDGSLPKLTVLAESLLNWDLNKTLQTSGWGAAVLTPEQISYAALDAVVALKVYHIQNPKLKHENKDQVYRLMLNALPSIAKMELNGIGFDSAAHNLLLNRWETEQKTAETDLRMIVGAEINLASPKQVSEWLLKNLGVETSAKWPKTNSGQLKTDAATLAQFSNQPLVQPLRNYKEYSKKISTYGEKYSTYINPVTNLIHANFKLGGTVSGRLSCSKPNIQNPLRGKEFRSLFCASQNHVLVVADYSQIELRVAALVSNDQNMLAAYTQKIDLHRKTAAAIAGLSIEQVSDEQRRLAKAVNFGLLYGQGAKGLAAYARANYGVEMSESEAETARNAFFSAYPDLRNWQQKTAKRAELDMKVMTPGGRVRDFRKEIKGYRYTEALNTPIQGGAAEIMLAALAALEHSINESGIDAKLVNVIHDEIVLEAAKEVSEQAKEILQQAMIDGMLKIFPDAATNGLVEANVGANWAEAK